MGDGQLSLPFFAPAQPDPSSKPTQEGEPSPASRRAVNNDLSAVPSRPLGREQVQAAHDAAPPLKAGTPGSSGTAASPLAMVSSLDELAGIARACTRCRLRAGCRQVVFGEGNPNARLMFVGEGPGQQEDMEGRPFVGRAGQLLDRMIEAMGLQRQDVYIANVVKCRPPGNRTPQPDEADACWPFLQRQIELINPEIIVCLGAVAAKRLLGPGAGVTKSRGRFFEQNGRLLAVTFHPAGLLRFPSNKKLAWEDLKMVMRALDGDVATQGA